MSELQVFKAKFIGLARIEQSISGRWPKVCIMGRDEYAMLSMLASDECTIPCEEINRSGAAITYHGIDCFETRSFNGMIFGCGPEEHSSVWEDLKNAASNL